MRIKGLDGLRAIAFLLVFFFHIGWLHFGWIGVQLFFVLSGFLITGILQDMKTTLAAKAYFIKFYGRRFLRIFPLYYFYLFAIWLIVSWMVADGYKMKYMAMFRDQFPFALTYIYDFYMASDLFVSTSNFLTHFWSLAVEEQFYIFWPLLVFLTPRIKTKQVFIFVVGLSILFRFAILFGLDTPILASFRSNAPQVIYALPFSHMEAFALGALLTVIELPKPRLQFYALLIGLPIVGILTDLLVTGKWGSLSNLGFPLFMPTALKPVWGYSAVNYFCAILIYGVARKEWFVRFLDSRPMIFLGKISYGLYIYHFSIIWFVTVPFGRPAMSLSPLTTFLAFTLTVIVASLSYYLIEKPLIDLKDRFFVVPKEHLRLDREPAG
jgi:peptidoglycan/LPS O-acetylase OafA/YrhL